LLDQNSRIEEGHGVDLSVSAIAYAKEHYMHPRIQYLCEDAATFSSSKLYDGIVSLETIEHVRNPTGFFQHIVSLLAPGGVLIASVPTTPSTDGNPNHVTDFTERSFRNLTRGTGLREIDCFRQVQPFSAVAVALGNEKRLVRTPAQLVRFYTRHPDKLALRMFATVRYGFENRYITIAWEKQA
jgi:cyclopropane fatty-acyl-phospholipid synthase-like methyltransferase